MYIVLCHAEARPAAACLADQGPAAAAIRVGVLEKLWAGREQQLRTAIRTVALVYGRLRAAGGVIRSGGDNGARAAGCEGSRSQICSLYGRKRATSTAVMCYPQLPGCDDERMVIAQGKRQSAPPAQYTASRRRSCPARPARPCRGLASPAPPGTRLSRSTPCPAWVRDHMSTGAA